LLEPIFEAGVLEIMKVFWVDEHPQEVCVCARQERGLEKGVDLENGFSAKALSLLCHGHEVQDRAAPTQDSEERVQGSTGIGEGVKPFRKLEPKVLGLWSEPCKDLSLHARFPCALVTIIHSEAQFFAVVLRRVEETSDAFITAVKIP
jgi:hypothetical protein